MLIIPGRKECAEEETSFRMPQPGVSRTALSYPRIVTQGYEVYVQKRTMWNNLKILKAYQIFYSRM